MSGSPVASSAPCGSPASGPSTATATSRPIAKFGNAVEHVPVGSIAAVFEEVNRRHVQFGLVPLENSTDGRIADTLEMFARLSGPEDPGRGPSSAIHHCLLGRCPWGEVRRVYSKAQALSQCRHWLGKNLPQAQPRRGRLHGPRRRDRPARAVRRRRRQPDRRRRLRPERPGREHRGPALQRHPLRRHRRAVRAARTGRDKTTLLLRLPTGRLPLQGDRPVREGRR